MFGAAGHFTYAPKSFDGRASRLSCRADPNRRFRLARAALLDTFPSAEIISTAEGSDAVVTIRDQKNIIRILADNVDAHAFDVSELTITARDGSGAFSDSRDKLSAGEPPPLGTIEAFATGVNLCDPQDVLARLGLASSDVSWLLGDADTGCFHFSGKIFGSIGRLSYSRTVGGAELFFLVGEDRVPAVSRTILEAAFPGLAPGRLKTTYRARIGLNDVLFVVHPLEDGLLLVTGMFFLTAGRESS